MGVHSMSFQRVWHPSLRLRILAPAALVAIPALALLVFMNLERRQQAESDITRRAEQLAHLATIEQKRLIEGTRQLLVALSQSRDIRDGDIEGCRTYLHQLVPEYGDTYSNIGFANLDGQVVCSGFGEPISIADRDYFQRGKAAGTFAGGTYAIGRQTGRPSVSFAYPVRDDAGALSGVVYAAVDLTRLNDSLTSSDWPGDATLIVTDRNNTIIAMHPDWQKWIGQSLANDPITRQIGAQAKGTIDFRERDEEQLFAFERITSPADTGLTVRVFVSKTQAMAAANTTMYEGLLVLGLVAILVMGIATAASDRLLMRPIVQLTTASRRLAGGDLSARAASSTSIPELSGLGKDFDDMAAGLEEREAARLRAETERKQLEHQYHQAQKMDAVGRLAGGIAHDFNNMLTAILGYCDLLLEDPGISESHRADVKEIEKAGRTAAALTRQLLAFSRREIIEPIVVDLNTVINGMDKLMQRLLGDNIRVETRLAGDLDNIKADRGQLEQVLLNLLVNARDAMVSGGRILIETRNVILSQGMPSAYLSAPPGAYVMLAVTDSGSGISHEVLPHLFEPFFTTKGTGKGTGLGLATVYGIVKQNGGGLSVESRLNAGTAFRIYLPSTTERSTDASGTVAIERAVASKATILVVEDDPGIRELASRVLSRYGYLVLTAAGGEEARKVSDHHVGTIHLLLSDVVMPGMSGPKVAEMLIGMRPTMKVIYMSGYTDDAILRHGVMAHDMPFLQKPFTPERLHNKILEVLGN
jgi:C4-dicarboxylate-specific signal transduction histidine kinase/CheY-like chemotaxis protein